MCGRYVTTKSARAYARLLRAETSPLPVLPESWNVCPTATSLTVREGNHGSFAEDWLVWGIQDATATPRFFNAKSETADKLPTFRDAWRDRHCVIPVDGWYEWREIAGAKQPYFFRLAQDGPLFLAGLWERRTFTLLTMPADGLLASYHHRRPVGMGVPAAREWIKGGPSNWNDLAEAALPGDTFAVHPVTRRVNRTREDGADLVKPVTTEPWLEQQPLL